MKSNNSVIHFRLQRQSFNFRRQGKVYVTLLISINPHSCLETGESVRNFHLKTTLCIQWTIQLSYKNKGFLFVGNNLQC